MNTDRNRVGVVLICTRKYDVFLQPLINSLEKHFFVGEPYDIYLFTDKSVESFELIARRGRLCIRPIESYTFPWVTLFRYKIMTANADTFTSEHLFYLDVDMLLVGDVGEDILDFGLVAVEHPGYWNGGWGSNRVHPESIAYLDPEKRHNYFCGGMQGGYTMSYLCMAAALDEVIDEDLARAGQLGYTKNNGILADWHDESYYNWFLKEVAEPVKILTPSYCYPESWSLPFEKKIIALDKDHKKIRE